jgi:OFA family oxalate/formate antiporter-like MFS transporter
MFLAGRWQERYGIRRMIILGILLTSIGCILAAFANSIAMVYAWAFINGAASCFVYIPALTLVQQWYPQRKGLVSGTVSMVFGLAAAIMSPVFGLMLNAFGYRNMSLVLAVLTLTAGLLGAYFARERDDETIKRQNEMRDALKRQIREGNEIDKDEMRRPLTVSETLHTRSFWFLWTTWILAGAAGVSMTVLSTGYGLSLGLPLEGAVLILTAFNLTNGTGRLASGYFSDRLGRRRVMSLAFLAAGLAYFLFPLAGDLPTSAILAAVVGLSFGTLFSVSAPLVADCFGLDHFGAIFGLTFAAYGFLAGPLGPTLSGYLLDLNGDNFVPIFLYLGAFSLLAALSIRQVVSPERR